MDEVTARSREWELARMDLERSIKLKERTRKAMIIIGSGGLGKEVAGMLIHNGERVDGFISNDGPGEVLGLPIFGNDSWLRDNKGLRLVLAIGTPHIRKKVFEDISWFGGGHFYPAYIDKSVVSYFPRTFRLGAGSIIMPLTVIGPDITIGRFNHINMGVTIGHDTRIGSFCVVNHNAAVSGSVTIGDEVLVGAGATILEGRTIGDGAIVGAGAVVTKDIPPGETWVGVPAKKMIKKDPLEDMTYAQVYGIDDVEVRVEVV